VFQKIWSYHGTNSSANQNTQIHNLTYFDPRVVIGRSSPKMAGVMKPDCRKFLRENRVSQSTYSKVYCLIVFMLVLVFVCFQPFCLVSHMEKQQQQQQQIFCRPNKFLSLIDPFIEKDVLSLADLKDFCDQKKPAKAIESLGCDPDTANRLVEVYRYISPKQYSPFILVFSIFASMLVIKLFFPRVPKHVHTVG
jgi:hypothetical protein